MVPFLLVLEILSGLTTAFLTFISMLCLWEEDTSVPQIFD